MKGRGERERERNSLSAYLSDYNCVKTFFLLLAFIDAEISSFGIVCPAFIKVYYYGLLRIAGFIVIALLHSTSYYSAIFFIVYRNKIWYKISFTITEGFIFQITLWNREDYVRFVEGEFLLTCFFLTFPRVTVFIYHNVLYFPP